MSLAKSSYLESKVLRHVLGIEAFTMPSTVYLALFTTSHASPDGTGGVEVTNANAYARQVATFTESAGVASNSGEIVFPTATGNWGTISGLGVYDSGTHSGGNLLYYGNWTAAKTIDTNDIFRVPLGNLDIAET